MPAQILQVDKNLQAIRAIEGAWRLPSVPDEVKLDLAGNTMMDPTAIGLLFNGLNADLEQAGKLKPPPRAETPPPPTDKRTKLGLTIAGATGLPKPQVLDLDSPQILKQRLSDGGYLDLTAEEIQSDIWLPEYSHAASKLNFDTLTKEFQGAKPGSLDLDSIFTFVDDWLSPRGLYSAAVELDLWFDFEQIGDEFEDWGNKVRRWNEDKLNPMKLIEMLTGPLDDILFPVLNIALIFSGFSQVLMTAKALGIAQKGASAIAGSYRGAKGLKFAQQISAEGTAGARLLRGAKDVQRFAEPSFVSRKLGNPLVMEQWRRNSAVILAKKVNQAAMKTGFASNLEQSLDDTRGGTSIDAFTEGKAGEKVYDMFSNPIFDWGIDIFFMPRNIWNPGTFSKPARATLAKVQRGFRKAAENQDMLIAWDRPVREYLKDMDPDDPYTKVILDRLGVSTPKAAHKKYKDMSKASMSDALSAVFFGGDKAATGAGMGAVAAIAAMDIHARGLADAMVGTPLHELDSITRDAWHTQQHTLTAQLKIWDPDNIEAMLTQIAKYGDGLSMAPPGTRRADVFYRNRRRVEEEYMESVESMLKRDGQVAQGHTRYTGVYNDGGEVIFTPQKAGDPHDAFFVDVNDADLRRTLGDANAASITSGAEELPEVFSRRYIRYSEDGIRHNRLSEARGVRTFDPVKLQKLRRIAENHNQLRNKHMDTIMKSLTPAALSQYVSEVLPTFGRWMDFTEASGEVAGAFVRGQLDNASFIPPMSDANRRLAALPWTPNDVKWQDEMFSLLLELPNDDKLAASLAESVFAPLAQNVDPQKGAWTLAGPDHVSKQEALAFAATAKRILRMVESVRRIRQLPDAESIFRVTADFAEGAETITSPGLREALAEAIGTSAGTDTVEQLARLARFAEEQGVTIIDVERVLMKKMNEINELPKWAERYRVPTQKTRTGDVIEEIKAKLLELNEQAYYMASEVENIPTELAASLEKRGYKLVYGVEFVQPFDLQDIIPQMADASRGQIRLKSLGDFFSRQDPKAIQALKARKVREALHGALANTNQKDGRKLQFGDAPDPTNADQTAVMTDLWDILHDVQIAAGEKLDTMGKGFILERVATRMSVARIPFDLTRLASDLTFKGFLERVRALGYNKDQANAMYKAIQKSQALGFRTHGLFAIESKLRSEPNLMNILRLLGATAEGQGIRKMRVGFGAVLGGYAANLTQEEGEDRLSFANMGKTFAGGVIGGVIGGSRLGIPGIRGSVDALEKTKLLRYAYLADYTANLRDLVRFSLSPIFDASRYSEAIILNQLGDLPPGVQNLRVNQSPRGFRKHVAREHRKAGKSAEQATALAKEEWGKMQVAFGEAASNLRDFDWEVIDGVGRRFASVGVLGFSPIDWMTSTFGHLVRGGAKPRKAYEVVRDIYTYGTTGRSAAELSMNFIFFPFSFTKKTVGHFAQFYADDLSRLIITHDLLATYQMLNDRFNLSEEWRDRLPLLDKVHRLNLLAYGVGLGRFGGVNASIIQAGTTAVSKIPGFEVLEGMPGPESIVNLFIPQMVPMNTTEEADSAWKTIRGIMPVINDITTMVNMLVEQGYVVGSEEHLTKQAEQRHAWDEWRTFQEDVEAELEPAGLTWAQAIRNPEINAVIQAARTDISAKYPAWKQGLGDGIAHGTAIDMELKERIQFPKSNGDLMLADFQEAVKALETAAQATLSNSPEKIPGQVFRILREYAIELAKENPEFLRLYNRFYRRNLGDIMTDVTA